MKRWTAMSAVVVMAALGVAGMATHGGDAVAATGGGTAEAAPQTAARELVERAGVFLEASSIGAAGASGAERLDAAVSSAAGFTTTWREMNEAQRAAANGFIERVLSPDWSRRVVEMITVSVLSTSERPVTLKITRAKGDGEVAWTWAVIGRDVTLELTFSGDRVVGIGAFTVMARGGRASMLAEMDRAAMQMMHQLPADLSRQAQWSDRHSGDSVGAPADAGILASAMNEAELRMFRELLEMSGGVFRDDVGTGVSRALSGEGWKSSRFVWSGIWHPSLPHAHRIAGEGFSVSVSMTPPKDEEDARARLEWRETW